MRLVPQRGGARLTQSRLQRRDLGIGLGDLSDDFCGENVGPSLGNRAMPVSSGLATQTKICREEALT
jgi:hypothetical protein